MASESTCGIGRGISLDVRDLRAGYGAHEVLHGITMHVRSGELVALIGHNGAGKSTLLKSVFGLIPFSAGRVAFDGVQDARPTPRALKAAGIVYLPQGNRVFSELTVEENVAIGAICGRDPHAPDRAFEMFPELIRMRSRTAATLSGGEKQMLALATALVANPRMLLLDEPSLGLDPALATQTLNRSKAISEEYGMSILIVEQKVRDVLRIAQRVYVLRNGCVSFEGKTGDLEDEDALRQFYL